MPTRIPLDWRSRSVCALVSAFLLSGCGGGGSKQDSTPPPSPPFHLSDQNAVSAGNVTFALIEYAHGWASAIISIAESVAHNPLVELRSDCELNVPGGLAVVSYDDNDGDREVSSGDVVRFYTEDCGGAEAELSLNAIGAGADLLGFSGILMFTVASDPSMPSGTEIEGRLDIDYQSNETESTTSLSDMAVTLQHNLDEDVDVLENGHINKTIVGLDYTVDFGGDIQSDRLGGSFKVTTAVPFFGILGDFPTAGEAELDAGNSRIQIAVSASPDRTEHADFRIDTEGSGNYGAATTVAWRDWMSGAIFNWYPLINGFFVIPANPTTSDNLWALANIYNPQEKALSLTYVWTVGTEVIVNRRPNAPVLPSSLTTSVIPFSVTTKGDRVEARLTAETEGRSVTESASVVIRNAPPKLSVFLSPESPLTSDAIKMEFRVSDADRDEVTTRVEWRVNGEIVEPEYDYRLPPNLHKKHDVVSVHVTSSDGEDETSVEASVTIEDAPPHVHVADVPDTVAYGSTVSFEAEFADADEDDLSEFRFALEYGPSGMAVDPRSGEVSWTATPPMFDRTMDVNWGIGSTDGLVVAETGTLRIVDSDRSYPLMRSGVRPPEWPSGLRIVDLDGDGYEEMLVFDHHGKLYELAWDGANYVQTWVYPFPINGRSGAPMAVADVNGDGHQDIFVVGDTTITKIDGKDRRISATAPTPRQRSYLLPDIRDVEIADVDNDGSWELVFVRDEHSGRPEVIIVSADDLSVRWRSPPTDFGPGLELANVDHDAALEIVVSKGYVIDGSTREFELKPPVEGRGRSLNGIGSLVGTGDLDGDGVDDIVTTMNNSDQGPRHCVAYSVAKEKTLGELESCHLFRMLTMSDIDDDGIAEILVDRGFRYVAAYRYVKDGGQFEEVFRHERFYEANSIGVGDIDHDGDKDVVFAGYPNSNRSHESFMVVDSGSGYDFEWTSPSEDQVVWAPFLGGQPPSPRTAPEDVLFVSGSGQDGPRAVTLSRSGALTSGAALDVSAGTHNGDRTNLSVVGAFVCDYDRDGTREILLQGNRGFLVAFDPSQSTTEWSRGHAQSETLASVHDLNGDGFMDLLTNFSGYDIVNDAILWTSQDQRPTSAAAGDLDGDGLAEIVTAHREVPDGIILRVYRRDDQNAEFDVSEEHVYEGWQVLDLKIEDTNGDGKPEVFVLIESRSDLPMQVIKIGPDMQILDSFLTSEQPSREPSQLLFYRAGEGRERLLLSGQVLAEYDTQTGNKIWEAPQLFGRVSPDSLHHVDSGEVPRFMIGTHGAVYMTR